MKTYESTLPQTYRTLYTLDAQKKSVGVAFTLGALVLTVLAFVLTSAIVLAGRECDHVAILFHSHIGLLSAISYLVYIVLHELTHGVAYYALTKQKLTFGMTWSVAYCGVPNIFVTKKTAIIALLAPFVVFNVVFLLGAFLCTEVSYRLFFTALFALHFGGCVGDLHATYLLGWKFRGKNILMNDTGPKQTYYTDAKTKG